MSSLIIKENSRNFVAFGGVIVAEARVVGGVPDGSQLTGAPGPSHCQVEPAGRCGEVGDALDSLQLLSNLAKHGWLD